MRINPEEKDELSTRLLKSLSMQMDEMSYIKEAQALIDSYSASINVALSEARGSVGIFKRLISSGKKKKSAREAAEYLLQMSEGDYGRRFW